MVARLKDGPAAMGAREALEIATLGGARVLGRSDIGALEPGKRADLVLWDVSELPGRPMGPGRGADLLRPDPAPAPSMSRAAPWSTTTAC